MSKQLKLRRGTTAQHSTFTGASGEVTVDTDKKTLVVHDGTTPGGNPVLSAAAGAVGTTNLASNSVTTDKMPDASVTAAKLASGASVSNLGFTPVSESQMTGQVAFFAKSSAPSGWLKANGALVSRTTYAALFAAIGTTFGAGDGSTTFALPDLRGEFPRGWDDSRGIDSGRSLGSAQSDAIRNITGSFGRAYGAGVNNPPSGVFSTGISVTGRGVSSSIAGCTGIEMDASTQVPTASENRPRNVALLACIKF